MKCKVCGSISDRFANGKILNKFCIEYYQCTSCGFIQTEDPFWLEESYLQAINESDVGIIARNLNNTTISRAIISVFFSSEAKFLDYGGGYGIFVRMMRDSGFDFYRSDKYCQNLFAKGFDSENTTCKTFELLTAFEVFEHFLNPVAQLDELLDISSSILFTTELFPSSKPKPEEWCYYGLEHGQHISFYTADSLRYLASSRQLNYYTNHRDIHLFTKVKISNLLFKVFCINKVSFLFNLLKKRTSLLADDYKKISSQQTF